MQIYQSGIVSEAVRTKLENAKSSVMGGTKTSDTQSFGDLIRSMMINTGEKQKVVGVSNTTAESTSPIASADGRTLLYALTNADTDTTASAVVGALGLPISDSNIKTDADSLTSSVKLLASAQSPEKEQALSLLNDFIDKYNTLITDLGSQTTASGIMYTRLFHTAADAAADALASAGITVGENGTLSIDAEKFESVGIEGFLNSVTTAANAVSTYASSITGSQNSSLLDFLGNDDDSTYSTSNYYSSLINSMM